MLGPRRLNWSNNTPQDGTIGRTHGWARGKVLGGSSAVNFNMFSMASRQDLNNWAELGNKGWDFDSLIPYYRKFETFHPSGETLAAKMNDKYLDKSLRGTSGPIHVSKSRMGIRLNNNIDQICFPETETAWSQDVWPKTFMNAGYTPTKDPRTGSAIGGFNQLNTIDPQHNRRSYAARDYYEPNADRPNMSLLTNALVTKVNLEKSGEGEAKATGVQFVVDGVAHTVKAKKEVLVCGGSVNSPQILELSGIGSSAVLHKAGIETIVELPGVGENLNDHTATAAVLVSTAYLLMPNVHTDPAIGG